MLYALLPPLTPQQSALYAYIVRKAAAMRAEHRAAINERLDAIIEKGKP